MDSLKQKICIVGGGSSSHTLIPLLSNAGHSISLLTRRPGEWRETVTVYRVTPDGSVEDSLEGRLSAKSDLPEKVVPGCSLIVLSLPVSKYREVLHRIAPWIDRDRTVYIGTIYGQGGFNWMVDEIKAKHGLKKIVTFACGLIPWITRTKTYGSEGITYGAKSVNVVAVTPREEFLNLESSLLNDLCWRWFKKGKFEHADNFLSLSLSVDNQIIHLARMYGLYLTTGGVWAEHETIPLFYRDFDDISADILRSVDNDYSKIRDRIRTMFPGKAFTYMLDYLALERLSYQTANMDIKESFVASKTLGQITVPVVRNAEGNRVFDKAHRFFEDDVYYGLCIAKWIAEKTCIDTPAIDRILAWAQDVLGDRIIDGGRLCRDSREPYKSGIPSEYGYTEIQEIVD